VHEEARDVVKRLRDTPEYLQSRRDRKKVEMLFAHLKRIMRFDRLRLRGPTGVTDEFTLAAAVQNLRKLAKLAFQQKKSSDSVRTKTEAEPTMDDNTQSQEFFNRIRDETAVQKIHRTEKNNRL